VKAILSNCDRGQRDTTMDKTEDKKKKQKKIHGTVVKVTDENVEEVAKDLVEKFRKLRRERKGH
jgi:hypothetical protein